MELEQGDIVLKLRWLLPSFVSFFVLSSPLKAANLEFWHFNANQNQLDLTTDQGVQPRVQLIANPARLIIDLPGIIRESPETTHQKVGSAIQEIRVGLLDDQTTRLVIELAPGYTLDPTKVLVKGNSPTQWLVRLPNPQQSTDNNSPEPVSIATIAPPETSQTQFTPPRGTGSGNLFAGVVSLNREMTALKPQVAALMAKYKFLQSGMFFLDLDTGDYLDINGDRLFPAASTIKLPILVAFFQDLDAGKVSLNETLVMRRDLVTGGSGTMQYRATGTKFSALETIVKMITISDNTATNMIIDRLGGIAKLNGRFRSWGLQDTMMHQMLADLRGTNTTSSKDMVRLLALLANQQLVSPTSREQIFDILRHTTIKTLLPAGLGSGAVIADKTGDIGFLIGDTGMITMPNGKRYLAGIYVRRPSHDSRGRDFIRQVSALVYTYLSQTNPVSSMTPRIN